jgi:methyltransferase (TIGR00027 family)
LTPEPLIRNISDTARWVAMCRAAESDRPDPLFRDPLARRLAGDRGEQILRQMTPGGHWAFALRTHLIDRAIESAIAEGFTTVLNLAAGFDTRPYRLDLPREFHWVEVDLPAILEEKQGLLRGETPRCRLDRVPVNLVDVEARRLFFARLGSVSTKVLIVAEGLLVYLERDNVAALARDLAASTSFQRWVMDLASPGLVHMLQKQWEKTLTRAGSPLIFGPPEGPAFFQPAGWRPREVHSLLHAAARARRLPLWLRLLALFPASSGTQGSRPWSAVCIFDRA